MHNPSHGTPSKSTHIESALWTKKLASSAINAFDVFRPSFEDPSIFKEPPSLVLICQPPSPFFRKAVGGVTTFLNTTEEGAWYALSTDRYPLLTSRVRPAPWVAESYQAEGRNATKDDMVGIHPIARTVEMKIDNPSLPAPNMPKLIEGGDWQNAHHGNLIKESPLLLLALLGIFILAIWKRHALSSVGFGRRDAMVENINIEPLEITTDKNPLPNGKIHEVEKVKSDVKSDVVEVQENDEISPAQEKKPRRKRGQRGGKNIKKRVGFVEPTTDVDEEEPGDPGDRNGYVHVALPKEISKDIPVNDQGNHAIDGLVVTDRLLGTTPAKQFNIQEAAVKALLSTKEPGKESKLPSNACKLKILKLQTKKWIIYAKATNIPTLYAITPTNAATNSSILRSNYVPQLWNKSSSTAIRNRTVISLAQIFKNSTPSHKLRRDYNSCIPSKSSIAI
jgi:hypothetical protein